MIDNWLLVIWVLPIFFILQTEEQSDCDGEDADAYEGIPSTSADDEQPGPSGVGQASGDAPWVLLF